MSGKVILLGAGPGSVDLLTVKGKEYIKKADCIIYDRLASADILSFARDDAELIFVGKENHNHTMKQDDINELLCQKALESRLVVRLKGGDPYVFGRGGEEALYLKDRQIEVEVLSGVTSPIAVLASAGIPITHRGIAKGFQVITAHSKQDQPSDIDYSQLLDETVTLVFLMGLAHVGQIAIGLMEAGRSIDTPAAVISRGTTTEQKKVVGTLNNIEELVRNADLVSPAIIVVGDVVTLSGELSFFEEKPLFSKKSLVPYIQGFRYSFDNGIEPVWENAMFKLLKEAGSAVSAVKVGRIIPRQFAVNKSDWLIFTSSNGVNSYMYNLMQNGLDIRFMSDSKIAVVGKKTAKELLKYGVCADLIPKEQTAEGLADELLELVSADDIVMYIAAQETEAILESRLSNCCKFLKIVAYENVPCDFEYEENDYDYVFLSSASTARRLLKNRIVSSDATMVSIGPSCTRAIEEFGISRVIQAKEPSYEMMVQAVLPN